MNSASVSPEIIICETPEQAARRVAQIIAEAIHENPRVVLGLATGSTPVATYRELVRMHRGEGLDFSQVTTFNLDEYLGLGADHPQSYRAFMQQHLFDHLNVRRERTHVPDGLATDLQAHAREYETRIREAGGIDLQLLGIGDNGHIAFNEPGSSPESRTRVVDLTEETIEANSRFFSSPDEVPRQAITMGIATILEAKRIVLMATGIKKADAVARALSGVVEEASPASQLQTHRDVTFILDAEAASQLST